MLHEFEGAEPALPETPGPAQPVDRSVEVSVSRIPRSRDRGPWVSVWHGRAIFWPWRSDITPDGCTSASFLERP